MKKGEALSQYLPGGTDENHEQNLGNTKPLDRTWSLLSSNQVKNVSR
jgi:hypothetical protein